MNFLQPAFILILLIQFSNCQNPVGDYWAVNSAQLQNLLDQCCSTLDGIERDCCTLIYPNVPDQSRSSSSTFFCTCPGSTNRDTPPSSSKPHPFYFGPFPPWYSPIFRPPLLHLPLSHEGCHPMTTHVAPPTQRLLDQCCYIDSEVALNVGLDCLALAFPIIPRESRCGQCPTAGTVQDLLHECCTTTASDGIERDCCRFLAPYLKSVSSPSSKNYYNNHCPCPTNRNNVGSSNVGFISTAGGGGGDENAILECHPMTHNISTHSQRLLNKCCITENYLGKSLDCLGLTFPNIPWNERCGRCGSHLAPRDLVNECCRTLDGISRDCCNLVYPNLAKDSRFCPCRTMGSFPMQQQQQQRKQRQNEKYTFLTTPLHFTRHHHHSDHHYHNLNGFDDDHIDLLQHRTGVEATLGLHAACCNTHGMETFGFNCEKLSLGKMKGTTTHGSSGCGPWSRILQPKRWTTINNRGIRNTVKDVDSS